MTIFKIPLNFSIFYLLLNIQLVNDLENMLLLNLGLSILLFVIHYLYFFKSGEDLLSDKVKTIKDFEEEKEDDLKKNNEKEKKL